LRERILKPNFWKDEDLPTCSAFARLLFAGLWGLADREGRLEDRPLRIKAEVFPYDLALDVAALLAELARPRPNSPGAFITRYQVDGRKYIQCNSFARHQRPHPNEKASEIPPPPAECHEQQRNGASAHAVLSTVLSTETPPLPSPHGEGGLGPGDAMVDPAIVRPAKRPERRARGRRLREDAADLEAYWIRLGGQPSPDDRRLIREALRAGRHTVQQLRASVSERVRDGKIERGELSPTDPWPPPGLGAGESP
jgi:hypothetical protein